MRKYESYEAPAPKTTIIILRVILWLSKLVGIVKEYERIVFGFAWVVGKYLYGIPWWGRLGESEQDLGRERKLRVYSSFPSRMSWLLISRRFAIFFGCSWVS